MHWGLLLFPVIGGYWFITHWNFSRYTASRQSGYHVLLRSGAYGIALYFAADRLADACRCECWVSWLGWISGLIRFLDEHSPDPLTTESALILILAFVSPYALNLFFRSQGGLRRAVNDSGEHLELLILNSSRFATPIEVTLDNRRVYIGVAVRSGVGKSPDADAAIFPYYSGYRDEKTLELMRDTIYTQVVSQHIRGRPIEEQELDRFRVVIPMSRIVSARPFEQNVFDDFLRARAGRDESPLELTESDDGLTARSPEIDSHTAEDPTDESVAIES